MEAPGDLSGAHATTDLGNVGLAVTQQASPPGEPAASCRVRTVAGPGFVARANVRTLASHRRSGCAQSVSAALGVDVQGQLGKAPCVVQDELLLALQGRQMKSVGRARPGGFEHSPDHLAAVIGGQHAERS